MKVFNKTKNCVVVEEVEVAWTFKEKSEGLLKYEMPHAMYFETRWGTCPVPYVEHKIFGEKMKHVFRNIIHPVIDFSLFWCGVHTFGMKFPIDVLVLDESGMVKKIRKNMKPGKFFFWNPKHRRILELPVGSEVEEGDVVDLI